MPGVDYQSHHANGTKSSLRRVQVCLPGDPTPGGLESTEQAAVYLPLVAVPGPTSRILCCVKRPMSATSAPAHCAAHPHHSIGSRAGCLRGSVTVCAHGRDRRSAEEAAQRRTFAALDVALRSIQSVLSATDLFGVAGSQAPRQTAAPPDEEESTALGKHAGKSKWVSFRAKCRSTRDVAQSLRSARRLDDYLCLPAEEYSLLDPSWVARTDGNTFRFSVPLGAVLSELMQGAPAPGGLGVLVPAITVTTSLDRGAATVTLAGSDASLGTAELDEQFSLAFSTSLHWKGGPPQDWAPPPPVFVAAAVTDELVELGTALGVAPTRGRGDEQTLECTVENVAPPRGWELKVKVDLKGDVLVPQPLASLPRPILGGAASLFATAIVQVLLPRFADMLASDYSRWAAGDDRRAPAGRFIRAPGGASGETSEDLLLP